MARLTVWICLKLCLRMRAYAKTDCGHCVYGASPVLTKEPRRRPISRQPPQLKGVKGILRVPS
jgi:hypothetical protein